MKIISEKEEYLKNLRISFVAVLMNDVVVSKLDPEIKKKFRVYRYRIDHGKISEEIMRTVVEEYGKQKAALVPKDKVLLSLTQEEYRDLNNSLPPHLKIENNESGPDH